MDWETTREVILEVYAPIVHMTGLALVDFIPRLKASIKSWPWTILGGTFLDVSKKLGIESASYTPSKKLGIESASYIPGSTAHRRL